MVYCITDQHKYQSFNQNFIINSNSKVFFCIHILNVNLVCLVRGVTKLFMVGLMVIGFLIKDVTLQGGPAVYISKVRVQQSS